MPTIKNICLLLCLMMSLPESARAEPDSVTFGGAIEYRPFHFLDDANRPAGFDVAVFERLAAESGWNVDYDFAGWSVVQERLASGEIDIVPMFISDARRRTYLFSTPILSTAHRLYGRRGETMRNSLGDLDGERVAAERGGYGWIELHHQDADSRIIGTDSEPEAVRLVARDAADFALVNTRVANHVIASEGLDDIVALSPPLLPVFYAFAVSPARPELVGEINAALQRLQESGTLHDLEQRWLTADPATDWREALQKLGWFIIVLVVFLALAGGLLWRRKHQLRQAALKIDTETKRRNEAEQKAEKYAVYDEVTGLPKTAFFRQYLAGAVTYSQTSGTSLAVAMITLPDLESIQQMAGYQIAEDLLRLEAQALGRQHKGITAYLGQGRFGFIMENITDLRQALTRLQALIAVAGRPYQVAGMVLESHVAAGLAVSPDHAEDALRLFRAADLALTVARQQRKSLLIYDSAMEPDSRNLTLMSDLGRAIESGALSWTFQPKYSLHEARIIGAEMLVRWQHPRHGWLSPALFIPLAEKTGLIKKLTRSAIVQAIKTVRGWGATGADWTLSANVSGNDLADPEIVSGIIDRIGDHAPLLTLEVTETALMQEVDAIAKNAELLQSAGIKLSLDDYGTGYSSLSYLKRMNFNELKIDMSFIRHMLASEKDRKIVQASIHLGHDLGMRVTAEGVEDLETARQLQAMDCDVLQGYGIEKPLPLDDFLRFSGSYRLQS